MTGLEQFKLLLKEYRSLSLWAAGGTVALPFVTQFVGFLPTWPNKLDVMTAVFQLVCVLYIYQKYYLQERILVTQGIEKLLIVLVLLFIGYISLYSIFVVEISQNGVRHTRGFFCTADALLIEQHAASCPWLDGSEILEAGSDVNKLWTWWSVAIVRITILLVWISIFVCLAAIFARFLTFQMNENVSRQEPPNAESS